VNVPFVDLSTVHRPLEAELLDSIGGILSTGAFILGPAVERFEEAFAAATGRRHCVAVNSGTSALHLALLAAGVGPGDEVVTTPHTWISTSWAISYCGATPVFAEIDPATGNLDPAAAEAAITDRTAALLPVDLYGNPADLPGFEAVAARHGIALVDDACQAHGARLDGRPVGSFGQFACFSFYPGKNLGAAGEGGAIVTDDDAAATRMRNLRNHAQVEAHVHDEIGFNYRMEGMQGAVLAAKLPHLDGWNDARRAAAANYLDRLDGVAVEAPASTPGADPNWHLFVVRHEERDRVAKEMQAQGIDVRFHYPTPVHLQPAYASLGHRPGAFPLAEAFAASCLSLPMFPGITADQQDAVIAALRGATGVGA
jgi:dTDP-4-amino-4,6-dideoxygalactose transaminase